MSEVVSGAGGTDQKSSGQNGNVPDVDSSSSSTTDSVSYETHRKLLAEKKKRDEEVRLKDEQLVALQRKEKEREENDLKEKENFKKLVEIRDKELADERAKYNGLNTTIQESVKFNSFLEALPGQIDRKFWKMVDTSGIVIDPSTGEPDPTSVKAAADKFQAEFSELIQVGGKAKLPNNEAGQYQGAMNDDVWNKMSAKDKKENLPKYHAWKLANLRK